MDWAHLLREACLERPRPQRHLTQAHQPALFRAGSFRECVPGVYVSGEVRIGVGEDGRQFWKQP